MTTPRRKTKALAVYIDPKYTDKVEYIKKTVGITKFVENALEKVKIDPKKVEALEILEK